MSDGDILMGGSLTNDFSQGGPSDGHLRGAPASSEGGPQASLQPQPTQVTPDSNQATGFSPQTQEQLVQWARQQEEARVQLERQVEALRSQFGEATLRAASDGRVHPTQLTPEGSSQASEASYPTPTVIGITSNQLKDPPKYSGKRENNACQQWISKIRNYFHLAALTYGKERSDQYKIWFAGQFLVGSAAVWWRALVDREAARLSELTFDAWIQELRDLFGDYRTEDTRRDRFDSLRQGRKTIAEFFGDVEDAAQLLLNTPTDAEKLRVFKRGLDAHIRQRIEIVPDESLPSKFNDYVKHASKMEREVQLNKQKNNRGFWTGPQQPRYSATPVDVDGDGDTVMNPLRSRGPLRNGKPRKNSDALSEWRRKCREGDLCFNCGKVGHRREDCKAGRRAPKGARMTPGKKTGEDRRRQE